MYVGVYASLHMYDYLGGNPFSHKNVAQQKKLTTTTPNG